MTTTKDEPDMPAAAIYEISTAPQPAAYTLPRLSKPLWALIIFAAMGILFLASVGAITITRPLFDAHTTIRLDTGQAHKAKPHRHVRPTPMYDLAGYIAATNGPQSKAFASALHKLRQDDRRFDWAAGVPDSASLINASNAWLSELRATKPPGAYLSERIAYVRAAVLGLWAGQATQEALTSINLGLLKRGQTLAGQAAQALSSAPANAPRGS